MSSQTSASSLSPPSSSLTSNGDVTENEMCNISMKPSLVNPCKNSRQSDKEDDCLVDNQRSYMSNAAPGSHNQTSVLTPALISTSSEVRIVPDTTICDHANSFNTSNFSSLESSHSAEKLSMQITIRRPICCWKTCGKMFSNLKELAVHINDDHVRIECPDMYFQCHWQGCPRQGKGFNARYKMLIHIRTHTNEKPHMCVVCKKSFSRLENLKIHTRSHTGEKPYICSFPGCFKAYSNSSDRFKHVRTHQEEKPYKCKMPGCQKQYTDPSSLRKHVRTLGHTFDSNAIILHHTLDNEAKLVNGLKPDDNQIATRHSDDQNNDLTNTVCCISNHGDSNHWNVQNSNVVDNSIEVIHNIATSIENREIHNIAISSKNREIHNIATARENREIHNIATSIENRDFRQNIKSSENYLETFSTTTSSEDRINKLDRLRVSECKVNNLERYRGTEDKVKKIDKYGITEDDKNVDTFRVSTLFSNRQNKKSADVNIQDLCSVKRETGHNIRQLKLNDKESSDKPDAVLNSLHSCNVQSGTEVNLDEQNNPDFVSNNDRIFKYSDNFRFNCLQESEDKSFFIKSFPETTSINFCRNMERECHERTKKTSPLTSISSEQSSKRHIEHWKKRKIMNPQTEPHNLLCSTMSHSQQNSVQRSHSTPALQSSNPRYESSNPPSVSPFSHNSIPSTSPFRVTFSSILPSPILPTSIPTPFSLPFPPLMQHSSPSVALKQSDPTKNSNLFIPSYHHPPKLYPQLPNTYSTIPSSSDTTIHLRPDFTLSSACSFLPCSNPYQLGSSVTNPQLELYPTSLLTSDKFCDQSEILLQKAKETWEPITFNYLQHPINYNDTSLLTASSLSHVSTRHRFSYHDFPLDLVPCYQNHRISLPIHLETLR